MNVAFWNYSFSSDPMPKIRNDEGSSYAEKMHRLFLLMLEYAESKSSMLG